MSITNCHNDICKNKVDVKNGIVHTCSLCVTPMYCSEMCRIMDWTFHELDCGQLINATLPVALPYHFEDELASDQLCEVPVSDPIFGSYKIRDAAPNRKIKETTVSALVDPHYVASSVPLYRGSKPIKELMQKTYTMSIQIGAGNSNDAKKVKGSIPHDVIYKDNPSNDVARKLAVTNSVSDASVRAQAGQTIYWPSNGVKIDSKLQDTFKINLYLGARTVPDVTIAGQYSLLKDERRKISRHVDAHMQSQLKTKFPTADSRRNLQVRAYDDGKNAAYLTFDVKNGNATLVDVELYAGDAKRNLDNRQSIQGHMYLCDAKNFESVIGLAMAIEEVLAEVPHMVDGDAIPKDRIAKIENANAIIKAYAYELHENDGRIPEKVPDQVHAAINAAVENMYEPMGIQFGIDYWRKKATKPYAAVHDEVVRLVKRSNEARRKWNEANAMRTMEGATRGQRAKAWFQEKVAAVSKSLVLRSLQHFSTAINEVINTKVADGVPEENVARYRRLAQVLVQAQQTIVTQNELDMLNLIMPPVSGGGGGDSSPAPAVPEREDE